MNKAFIRKRYKLKRLDLTPKKLNDISLKIINQMNDTFDFSEKLINIFLPIEKFNEIDLTLLIDHTLNKNGLICINKTDFKNHSIIPYLYSTEIKLEISDFGVPEPSNGIVISPKEINYVIVPLLACDKHGYRVGYGKGFYDAFLSQCHEKTTFIGVNHFNDLVHIDNVEEHDIPIHYLVTPEKIFKF